jgi:hypothetical protein
MFDFFATQVDKYGGVSIAALRQLRNLRDAIFQKSLTRAQAAREDDRRTAAYSSTPDDRASFPRFAEDLTSA